MHLSNLFRRGSIFEIISVLNFDFDDCLGLKPQLAAQGDILSTCTGRRVVCIGSTICISSLIIILPGSRIFKTDLGLILWV